MIWESWPWKHDVERRALALRRRAQQRRWPEESCAKVEQDIFLSAYSVRKLLDAFKISDEVESTSLRGMKYSACGRTVDLMNWHRIDELYDISNGTEACTSLRDFCNLIIHSFVFILNIRPRGGLEGFFVASDRKKDRCVVYFDIGSVIDALLQVAQDNIVTASWSRDVAGGVMKVDKKSNRLPAGENDGGQSSANDFWAKP